MHGVWELSIHCNYIQSMVSQATSFFLLNYKFNLGGMALLKTDCHMPLISLRDMPSATIFNDDSKKYEEEEEEDTEETEGGRIWKRRRGRKENSRRL